MTTKAIQVDSLRISYRESSGKDSAVVLVHGNSVSSRVFEPQLKSPLGEKYRLVAIDLPGSRRDSNPRCDPSELRKIVLYKYSVYVIKSRIGCRL
jgi:pimeloyl-ACP methyl ester carboxylesterase